jgi:hypothetical protein
MYVLTMCYPVIQLSGRSNLADRFPYNNKQCTANCSVRFPLLLCAVTGYDRRTARTIGKLRTNGKPELSGSGMSGKDGTKGMTAAPLC